jgi:hypothetical protein
MRAKPTAKARAKARVKFKTRTIECFDAAGNFDAKEYCAALWPLLDGPYYNVCKPYTLTRPLTLAEHAEAEAEAHRQMEARLDQGPDGVPTLEENLDDGNETVDVQVIESFADDVLLDMRVWEKVANDYLAANAAQPQAKKAA